MIKFRYTMFVLALLFNANLFSDNASALINRTQSALHNMTTEDSDHQVTIPISTNKDISLIFDIPNDLKNKKDIKAPSNPDETFIFYYGPFTYVSIFTKKNLKEFIDEDDQTSNKEKSLVSMVLDSITNSMKKNTEVTLLEQGEKDYSGYSDGYRIVKRYSATKGTVDVVYVYFAGGPTAAALIYYTLRIHDSETVDTLVSKLKETIKKHVRIKSADI